MVERYHVRWSGPDGLLVAEEPTPSEVQTCASALAQAYSEPHNRAMMTHTGDTKPEDVVSLYTQMIRDTGRPFLLYHDQTLMGDADFRQIEVDRAEFAIMVGERARQGRGFGTRFATMLHLFAFRTLRLQRVYVTIIPENIASQRLFARLGYVHDDSPQARAYSDEPGDICMSVGWEQFEQAHSAVLGQIQIQPRAHDRALQT